MGFLSNKINKDQLKPGDHIYSWRNIYLYAHHGIYVGEGKVIHFTRVAGREFGTGTMLDHFIFSSSPSHASENPCTGCDETSGHDGVVMSSSLDCFLSGGNLYLFEYGVNPAFFIAKARGGTCTVANSDPSGAVLHRAFYLLQKGFGTYRLFRNNCEDFAIYCKTGFIITGGTSGQANSIFSAMKATGCVSVSYLTTYSTVGVVGAVLYCYKRLAYDIGIREDVKKVPVENLDTVTPVEYRPQQPSSARILAYEELKQSTNNFESACILDEGRYGKVYKGVLTDGTVVAIKRLAEGEQKGGDKGFMAEVEMLSRLHHRNIVKLVGYCSGGDSSQNLVCYEHVPNGSLEDWLHGPLGVNCHLDWNTRMKIAHDAARGLAHLHKVDSQPCVIHRDFKASSILLENDFLAKVADFGLAKYAPDQGRTNNVSKTDVYNYGVVLLELLTGRRPVDMSQRSGQGNLVTWARSIVGDKDRLEEFADPNLRGKYRMEEFVQVCTIAVACVAPVASQRPTMGEVVQTLVLH